MPDRKPNVQFCTIQNNWHVSEVKLRYPEIPQVIQELDFGYRVSYVASL